MMSGFLATHGEELVRRCAAKVALRPVRPSASPAAAHGGISLFLAQLQRTLEAEERQEPLVSLRISGAPGGDALAASEMGAAATRHGQELLALGYSVDQVVHGYGDLCQAVTDLAFELDVPIGVSEFRTLNRCLDNGIANAVAAFSAQRDATIAAASEAHANERQETLLHALRSSLATASYAVTALELGNLPVSGATGTLLKRSLATMRSQVGGPSAEELQKLWDEGR
jgi:hypothetical protein